MVSGWALLVGFGCFLGAIGALGYQVFIYLKDGVWPALSVLDVLKHADKSGGWTFHPTDWYGLHQAFDWTPLALGLFVGGLVAVIVAGIVDD